MPSPIPAAIQGQKYISLTTRRRLMAKAYAHTAAYDSAIADYFERRFLDDSPLPPTLRISLPKVLE